MDTLTTEETEAFYNDIAVPPVPPFDTSARSYPSQIDLLLQNGSGEASIAQQGILTGGGSGSSSSTPAEKHGSSTPTPHRGESPLYGSSSTRTLTCSTSAPYSSSAATVTLPAASTAVPLQQDQQQPQQGSLALQEERSLASSGAPRLQIAGAATAGAGAGVLGGVALPAAAALAASRRDTGGDLSGGTVNLFDQQGNQKNAGGRPGCFVPPTSQTPAALPRGAVDSNSSSRVGVRAACSYGGGGDAAAGGREVLPFAVSQVQALYLAVRRKVFGRTAPWREFCRLSSFERPATGAVAVDRVERNVRFFFMNYALLCAALGVLAVIMNPAILVVGAIFGGAAAAAGLHGGNSIRIGESTVVPVKNVRYFCGAAGLLTLLCVAGQLIVGLLVGCAVLILLHAALHVGVSYEKIAQHCVDDLDCAV